MARPRRQGPRQRIRVLAAELGRQVARGTLRPDRARSQLRALVLAAFSGAVLR